MPTGSPEGSRRSDEYICPVSACCARNPPLLAPRPAIRLARPTVHSPSSPLYRPLHGVSLPNPFLIPLLLLLLSSTPRQPPPLPPRGLLPSPPSAVERDTSDRHRLWSYGGRGAKYRFALHLRRPLVPRALGRLRGEPVCLEFAAQQVRVTSVRIGDGDGDGDDDDDDNNNGEW